MLTFVKLRIAFSMSLYIKCVILCLFSALRRGVDAFQMSIILDTVPRYTYYVQADCVVHD